MFKSQQIKAMLLITTGVIWLNALSRVSYAQSTTKSTHKTIVIPLTGTVGAIYGVDRIEDSDWFNGWVLQEILEKAKKDKDNVTRVVLEIDSPGGYTFVRDEICDVIEEYRNDFVFIAYPHDAFSAASTIAMTCDELYVAPDTKLGAAVVLSNGDAVSEKYASADASKVRAYYANARKPTAIPDAFSLINSELWYHEGNNTFASEKPEEGDGWVQLDDSDSILTFDADQLLRCKLALEKVTTLDIFYKKDEFENWSDDVKRLMKKIRKSSENLKDDFHEVWELINEITNYESSLYTAYRVQNKSEYNRVYTKFRRAVAKAVIKAKGVLKDIGKDKYHFYIPTDYIGRIAVIRELGQNILDDEKYECENIFRHLNEMRDAYNDYSGN